MKKIYLILLLFFTLTIGLTFANKTIVLASENTTIDVNEGNSKKVLLEDINSDGEVNILDYIYFRKIFNCDDNIGPGRWNKENADINQDGKIDFLDLLALQSLI